MYEYLRKPWSAAIVAACVTMVYIHFKAKMNGYKELQNHEYIKPGFLVGVLVYFIIHLGNSETEPILKTI